MKCSLRISNFLEEISSLSHSIIFLYLHTYPNETLIIPKCSERKDVYVSVFMPAQSLNHVQLFVTPWTVAPQVPLSMEFPRQGYWSGLPLLIPGDLPDPGIKPTSLLSPALAGRFFTTAPLKQL